MLDLASVPSDIICLVLLTEDMDGIISYFKIDIAWMWWEKIVNTKIVVKSILNFDALYLAK